LDNPPHQENNLRKLVINKYSSLSFLQFLKRCLLYGYIYVCFPIILLWHKIRGDLRYAIVVPTSPRRPHGLWKILKLNGFYFYDYGSHRIPPAAEKNALIIYHESSNVSMTPHDFTITIDADQAINGRIQSISKDNIEDVFEHVFKYPLRVDPFTFTGLMVKKSKKNSAHDGIIIQGPIERIDYNNNYVYEKVINNQHDEKCIVDMRIIVVGEDFPLAWLKYRPINSRFKNFNTRVRRVCINEILSENEIKKLKIFINEMAIDFGEIDILRDNNTGHIYIVDVNPTPHAPPAVAEGLRGMYAMHSVAKAFEREFLVRR